MPVVSRTVSWPVSRSSSPAGPSAPMRVAAARRRSDLADAEARKAVRSLAQASRARAATTASRTSNGARSEAALRWSRKALATTVAISHACAITRNADIPPAATERIR